MLCDDKQQRLHHGEEELNGAGVVVDRSFDLGIIDNNVCIMEKKNRMVQGLLLLRASTLASSTTL